MLAVLAPKDLFVPMTVLEMDSLVVSARDGLRVEDEVGGLERDLDVFHGDFLLERVREGDGDRLDFAHLGVCGAFDGDLVAGLDADHLHNGLDGGFDEGGVGDDLGELEVVVGDKELLAEVVGVFTEGIKEGAREG